MNAKRADAMVKLGIVSSLLSYDILRENEGANYPTDWVDQATGIVILSQFAFGDSSESGIPMPRVLDEDLQRYPVLDSLFMSWERMDPDEKHKAAIEATKDPSPLVKALVIMAMGSMGAEGAAWLPRLDNMAFEEPNCYIRWIAEFVRQTISGLTCPSDPVPPSANGKANGKDNPLGDGKCYVCDKPVLCNDDVVFTLGCGVAHYVCLWHTNLNK